MFVLGLQRKRDFHGPLSWNLWCWAELEIFLCISNLPVSNRGWQAHHSLLSLHPRRKLTFPSSWEFPVPGSLKGTYSWRSPVVSGNFWLQIEAGKQTKAGYLFIPARGSLFPHPANFLSQVPGKVLIRVSFLRAVFPEPRILGSSSHLKRKHTTTCTHPLRPFAL